MKLSTKRVIAREFIILITCLLITGLYYIGTLLYNYHYEQKCSELNSEIEINTAYHDSIIQPYSKKLANQLTFHDALYGPINPSEIADNLKVVYDRLRDANPDFPDFEQFKIDMQDDSNLKKVRAALEAHIPDSTGYKTSSELWMILKSRYESDSVEFYFNKKWSNNVVTFLKNNGCNSSKQFLEFVSRNLITHADSINYQSGMNTVKKITQLTNKRDQLSNRILDSSEQLNVTMNALIILVLVAFPFRYIYYGIRWSIKILNNKE